MLEPDWNLHAIQATTSPAAPLVVMHGPVAERIGANASYRTFVPGNRANATIGRAVRLVLLNVGGGWPDNGHESGQGAPRKHTYCIDEHPAVFACPALHVRRGLREGSSAVTVFGVMSPENVSDHVSEGPVGVLTTMASVIATIATDNCYYNMADIGCLLSPEHARTIADAGWGIDDVTHWLYEHARLPLGELKKGGMYGIHAWPPWQEAETDDAAR